MLCIVSIRLFEAGVKVEYNYLLKRMKDSFKTKTFMSQMSHTGIQEAISDAKDTDKEEARKNRPLLISLLHLYKKKKHLKISSSCNITYAIIIQTP